MRPQLASVSMRACMQETSMQQPKAGGEWSSDQERRLRSPPQSRHCQRVCHRPPPWISLDCCQSSNPPGSERPDIGSAAQIASTPNPSTFAHRRC